MLLTKTFTGYSKNRTEFISNLWVKVWAVYVKQMTLFCKGIIISVPPTQPSHL